MIGQTVKHYTIVEKLGEGGMGVVYKAQDNQLNRVVALKFLPDRVNKEETARARFLQEARAAAGLNHPNICTIHGVEEYEGSVFIVMEYVDGGTLREKLPFEKMSDAITLAIQIGEALQEAHVRGIVHRDIKADNIMLSSKGQAKVMDFGLAKLKGALKLTRTSSTIGTLGYMAPEQIQGGVVDHRSDVFAFGVVFFEMLTGKLPFRGEHEAAMMYSILHESPVSLRTHRPQIPDACQRIVDKALEKNPDERYQTIADLLADLRRWKRDSSDLPRVAAVSAGAPQGSGVSSTSALRILTSRSVIAGALAMVAIAVILILLRPFGSVRTSQTKTLAVIPFANQSEPEREYFADGITEEITTRLSSLSGIGVIARSSAWQYKGLKQSVKEIGSELGVNYVLMGTVRWSGGDNKTVRVRVSPELVDVSSGLQVWANTFDAPFSDAFSIQSDIARQVAQALDLKILSPEASALEQTLTSNAEAYDYYLQGIQYENRSPSKSDADIAIQQYERAISLDPSFAAAYARLATTHARTYWFYHDRTNERVEKARSAAQQAVALAPNLSVVHEAMGWCYYHTKLDYTAALEEFSRALSLQPNNPGVSYGMAAVYRRKGDLNESIKYWRNAIAGSPRESELVRQYGETLTLLRRYEEADEQFQAAIRLAPDNVGTYSERAKNFVLWKGDTRAAQSVLREAFQHGRIGSGEDHNLQFYEYLFSLMEGDVSAAQQSVEKLEEIEGLTNQFVYYPRPLLLAYLESWRGSTSRANELYRRCVDILQQRLKGAPEDERAHSALGIAYAGLGRLQDAVRAGERGRDLLPLEKEAWRGSYRLMDLAHIYTMTGDHEKAIDLLQRLLTIPSDLSAPWLKLDPRWKPLRSNKRFQALVGGQT